jgi:hypothetical protein
MQDVMNDPNIVDICKIEQMCLIQGIREGSMKKVTFCLQFQGCVGFDIWGCTKVSF